MDIKNKIKKVILVLFLSNFNIYSNDLTFQFIKDFDSKEATGQLKKSFLENLKNLFKSDIFFETGTYKGDTTYNALGYFKEIHTIELDLSHYHPAKERFKSNKNVHVYQGNSAELMQPILSNLNGNILFWLDAHMSEYSTPITRELELIKDFAKNPVILIDDLRFFKPNSMPLINLIERNNFPNLAVIYSLITKNYPNYEFIIFGDTIMAFAKSYGIKISQAVKAMTLGKIFDDVQESNIKVEQVIECEMLMAKTASESEKDAIKKQYNFFKPLILPVSLYNKRFFSLWYGLIIMGEAKYQEAIQVFENIRQSSNDRVDFYIQKCKEKI